MNNYPKTNLMRKSTHKIDSFFVNLIENTVYKLNTCFSKMEPKNDKKDKKDSNKKNAKL